MRRTHLQFAKIFDEIMKALLERNVVRRALGDYGISHPHRLLLVCESF